MRQGNLGLKVPNRQFNSINLPYLFSCSFQLNLGFELMKTVGLYKTEELRYR